MNDVPNMDHTYLGVPITCTWPAASLMPGSKKPEYKKWEAYVGSSRVAAYRLSSIKSKIRLAKEQEGTGQMKVPNIDVPTADQHRDTALEASEEAFENLVMHIAKSGSLLLQGHITDVELKRIELLGLNPDAYFEKMFEASKFDLLGLTSYEASYFDLRGLTISTIRAAMKIMADQYGLSKNDIDFHNYGERIPS